MNTVTTASPWLNTMQTIGVQDRNDPDTVFLRMVEDNLFCHDKELSAIHQRAYFALRSGESIAEVRFRYERETNAYLQLHMWDD